MNGSVVTASEETDKIEKGLAIRSAANCQMKLISDNRPLDISRDGEVTFEKELSSSSSYYQMRNLGT